MRNSEFILQALDECLERRLHVTLHLLGGAAIDLVYGIRRFSEDVDCMCTLTEAETIDSEEFQKALSATNNILQPRGFYLTHILTPTGPTLNSDQRTSPQEEMNAGRHRTM